MESMYQRGKIQEESLIYETKKHNGDMPIIGVNTFLSSTGSPTITPSEVIRATEEEKQAQIKNLNTLRKRGQEHSEKYLSELQEIALNNGNTFAQLMETVKHCSLGQITHAMFEVGGQYRRNM
jgi:methylmalonyl-CoA mutase